MARSEARLLFDVMEGLKGLEIESKVLYFALLVEPTVNQAGVGALRERRWAKDTELSMEATQRALQDLEAGRYVFVDFDTEEVLVRTLIRRDGVADKPNVLWAACRAAEQVKSPKLRRELAEELRKLPPKPPDKPTKSGGVYVHPDPHAVADKIDPGPPDKPDAEPSGNHTGTFQSVPVGTLVESFSNGSADEPLSNHSRTTGGGGGGGGGGTTSVSTSVLIKDHNAHTREDDDRPASAEPYERDRTRSRPSLGLSAAGLAELNDTAHTAGSWSIVGPWKASHETKYRPATYSQICKEVDRLLANNADPKFITVALKDWDGRGKGAPGFLKHCYDDAVHATRPPSPIAGTRNGGLWAVNGSSALKRDPISGRIVER